VTSGSRAPCLGATSTSVVVDDAGNVSKHADGMVNRWPDF
jgi:hypothetical protein